VTTVLALLLVAAPAFRLVGASRTLRVRSSRRSGARRTGSISPPALSWARGRISDDDSFAADVPAPAAVLTARHSLSDRVWWRVKARLVARDETPSFAVFDVSAGFALVKSLEAVLLGANLTDERYPLSPDEDAPPAPGRSFGLALHARW